MVTAVRGRILKMSEEHIENLSLKIDCPPEADLPAPLSLERGEPMAEKLEIENWRVYAEKINASIHINKMPAPLFARKI